MLDDDLDVISAQKVAEGPELLERNSGRDGGSDRGDQLPPARVDSGFLTRPENSAAGGFVSFADALAIGIDVIPQSLRKVLRRGSSGALHVERFC